MTTYFIENTETSELIEYFTNLHDAKYLLKHINKDNYRLVQLKGPYKYEGYHQYEIFYINNKFIKNKLV